MSDYRFIHSSRISGGGRKPVAIGYPKQLYMINDVCLCAAGKSDFIALNSLIVREALLSDPEGIARMFGVKVIDLKGSQQPVRETAKADENPVAKKQKKKAEPIIEDLGEIKEDEL